MASGRIKGITIEIDGDTKKLTDSLSGVDKSLRQTQTNLKDVNKLLKLDPKNTELLNQKQELLKKALADSKKEVLELNKTLGQMGERNDQNADAYDRIQREIIECQQQQAKWNAELDEMTPKAASIQDKLQSISDATGKAAQATKGLSTAAGVAAGGLIANTINAAKSADELDTLSQKTGFSVEELQKMKYASELVDVSFDTMTGSMAKLTKSMANGSDAFGQLGISVKDEMTGQLRDANEVWYETLWALSKVENDTQRDALAMNIFGKSAAELSGIVDDGGVSLIAYGNEAEELGLILSGDDVKAAHEFNDAMDTLKARTSQAFLEAGASLAETLTPALENLVKVITNVLTWFSDLDGGTQAFILTVLALVASISPILGIISALTGAAAALNVAMLPMIGTIAGIIAIIGLVVAAGVLLYKNWDKIKAAAMVLWQNIQTAFNNIKTTIMTVFQSVMTTVSSIANNIRSTISSIFSSIPGIISGALGGIVGIVSGVFNSVRSTISGAIEGAVGVVQGAVERIKGAFNFSWSLPPIKLPHISVSGGVAPYGIAGKGSLPHFSIQWYKKAYENAVLFRNPTVLPTLGGMKGFGDGTGSEMVIGTNKLLEMMGKAGGTDIDINIYTQPGMNETAIANAVAVKLDRWFGERL